MPSQEILTTFLSSRPSWDDTLMRMLPPLEDRSTCYKYHCACILFDPVQKDIIKVGYNGAPHGMPHCAPDNLIMDGPHHINDVHAEDNGITKAGDKSQGAWLYCSLTPCRRCAIKCVQGRISRFMYRDTYNIQQDLDFAFATEYFSMAGIEFVQWNESRS